MTLPTWTTACPDWRERIVNRRSLIPFDPLYPDEGKAALAVFKSLRMTDVRGQPTFGEACDQWVFDFVEAIFGAYDPIEARRRINSFFLLISKKNGKSTIAAGIMLTALIRNWRFHAELLILAPTLEIANNSFKPAAAMVRIDPELVNLLHVQDHKKEITHRVTHASLKVIAADSDTVGGKKASFIYIDELWLFGKKESASAMLMEATGGLASRPEGFTIYSSTHADDAPAGVFKARLEYFRNVRDGVIDDPKSLGLLFEFPDEMLLDKAFVKKENWYITNPSLGTAVDEEFIEARMREAETEGDHSLRIFYAKHLNVEVGLALRDGRWRGADYWLGAKDPQQITLESLIERSEVIVVGGDGGGLDDLLALSFLGRDKISKDWLCWVHAWAQDDVLKNRKEIAERLRDFVNDGDLTISQDAKADVMQFCDMIKKVHDTGLIPAENGIGLDPASITTIVDELAARGIHTAENGGPIVGAKQSALALSPSIWGLERKLKDATFWHAGQPMMAWCVSNAKAEQRGNAVLITKQTAGKAKIDPLVATFNAVMLMSRNPIASLVSSPWDDPSFSLVSE